MATTVKELLNIIEPFCIEYKIGKSEFGTLSCKNPNLLNDLRKGHAPTLTTVEKIVTFIKVYKRNRDRTMERFYLPQGDTGLHEMVVVGKKGKKPLIKQIRRKKDDYAQS